MLRLLIPLDESSNSAVAGPFRIYRAPGSVAFLSCCSALQPILPKSQVWCVDEASSKFVLQIRRPQYWRIEVPVEHPEDVRRAQRLREVFDAILLFEKTECPFQRPFTVELPKRPQTPVKKRPWTPVRRSSASLPLTPVTPVEIAHLYSGTPRGSICMGDLRGDGGTKKATDKHAKKAESRTEEPNSKAKEQTVSVPLPRIDVSSPRTEPPHAEGRHGQGPAIPQHAIVITAPCSEAGEAGPVGAPDVPRFKASTESLNSLHHPEPWRSAPLPPSPPLSNPGSPRSPSCQQDASGHAVPPNPTQRWSVASSDSLSSSECSLTTAPSSPQNVEFPRTRNAPAPASARPEEPPKPSSSNLTATTTTTTSSSWLLPPQPRRRAATTTTPSTTTNNTVATAATTTASAAAGTTTALAAVRNLPLTTVFTKTRDILLSPPSHLLSLMLKVAARITAGEWRGLAVGRGEGGERMSVQWDWSDEDVRGLGIGVGVGDDVGVDGVEGGRVWDAETDGSGSPGGDENETENGSGSGSGSGGGELEEWPKRKERGAKMAGSFPESDDEDEYGYGYADGNEGGEDSEKRERSPSCPTARCDGEGVDRGSGSVAGLSVG